MQSYITIIAMVKLGAEAIAVHNLFAHLWHIDPESSLWWEQDHHIEVW